MSSNFQDVHIYDGKWDENIPSYSEEYKKRILSIFRSVLINQNMKCEGIDLLITDIGKDSNYESCSKLYADDILVSILKKIDTFDKYDKLKIFKLINEQLDDMYQLGRCPSGRVTRLIQIYKSLIDDFTLH